MDLDTRVALVGPNGAGKTTTMRMIIAEENPTQGKIRIGKHNIESNTSPGFDQLGYCPQVTNYSLFRNERFMLDEMFH